MKNTKRLMLMNYNYYKEIEQKLELYAKKGLVLEKMGPYLWTFKKTEPQNLKYTVTYFAEGSVFNPHPTDNQQTYFDYAKAAGWDFVCEYNQMQIFCSSLENPPEFETDEKEKLENIHKCMKKSFVVSQLLMLVVFALNLFLRLNSLKRNPTDFLSSNIDLATFLMFFCIILYSSYTLINYYMWYNKSKKSVDMGGSIIENFNKTRRYFDIGYLIFLFSLVGYMFIHLLTNTAFGIIALSVVQLPLFALIFWGSITLLKRRKISANANKIISISLLIITGVLYLGFIFYSIPRFSFSERSNKPYTTVDWEVYEGMTREYRLYSDKIPLTCEDLYGHIDFEYYSYEADEEDTPLLHRSHYSQTRPPMKNAPPKLEYSIYKPKFEFVKNIVVSDLTKLEDWSDRKLETLDNAIFSTEKAYAFYYEEANEKLFSGEYILVFTDKIIQIDAETSFTDEQIEIIKNKLLSGNNKV
ncbi:MAG: DUF2812 domain-containing protein [Tissierellia bacterium]|jgi:hypothetical protein|nr:DUF2812 domain-containing protein [Tissierellia bacterium]